VPCGNSFGSGVSGDFFGAFVSFVDFGGGAPKSSPDVTAELSLLAPVLSVAAGVSLFVASAFGASVAAGALVAVDFGAGVALPFA
jgi:hypothetical protein